MKRFGKRNRLTVAVLTFNQEQYVAQALDSVMNQAVSIPFDLLIHDDASTDTTQHEIRTWLKINKRSVPNSKVILRRENLREQGLNTRPAVLKPIRTEFVAWCDGDDYWTDRNKLEKQVNFMDQNLWCSVCHHDVVLEIEGRVPGDDPHLLSTKTLLAMENRKIERQAGPRLVAQNTVVASSVMLRRSSVRDSALDAMKNIYSTDWLISCVAMEDGDLGFLSDNMSAYRMRRNSAWQGRPKALYEEAHRKCLAWLSTHAQGEIQREARVQLLKLDGS